MVAIQEVPVIRFVPGNTRFSESLAEWTRCRLHRLVQRHHARITRIEVYFEALSSARNGRPEMRCLVEARIDGRGQLVAEHRSHDPYIAATVAARRLLEVVEHALSRRRRAA